MLNALSVISPCYNEAENIVEFVERTLEIFDNYKITGELILVNDASTDKTGMIIDELVRKNSTRLKSIHNKNNLGLAGSWKCGLAVASAPHICIIDSDLQYQPEEIPQLYDSLLKMSVDIVQGYRNTIHTFSGIRYLWSRALCLLLNCLFGMKLSDNKSGFFVCTKETANLILSHRFNYYYFQILIMASAAAHGFTISEQRVQFLKRKAGKSFMSSIPIRVILGCLHDLCLGIIEFRLLKNSTNNINRPSKSTFNS